MQAWNNIRKLDILDLSIPGPPGRTEGKRPHNVKLMMALEFQLVY
jgi:hypothetical protein